MKQTGIIKRFIHIWILLMATAFYAGAQVSLQANNDEMWTGPFEKVRKNIIKNDVIPGDTYDWTIVTASLPNPAKGVFVKDGNFLVFTPNASCKNENVSIEYKLVSGMETSTATVTIHVSELNSPVNMIYPDAECVSPMTGVVEFTPSLKFTTDDDHNDGFSTPLIGDLNGDGKPEIVALGVDEGGAVLAYGRYIKIYDGQTGAQLINFDLQGLGGDYASTSQFFLRSVPYHNAPSNLAIADLDRDGIGEIVVCETGSNGRVYALKPTLNSTTKAFISPYLSKIWDASVSFKAPLTTTWDGGYGRPMPYIADLNGDGIPEVIVYNKIYNGQNGKLLMAWNGAASSSTASSIVSGTGLLVYRDASPFTESTDATDIRNRAMTGRRPANSSYADDYVAVSSIVDIDGDGTQEIITGNRIYKIQINNLNDHTLNTYTTIEGPVSVTLPVSTSKSTTETYYLHDGFTRVADIDGDGYLDIVVTTFVDGSLNPTILVYVWDPRFPAVVKAALTYWGDGGDGNYGIPFIGDINGKNDGWTGSAYTKKLPEICIISGSVYINRVEDNSGRSGIKFHGLSDGQLRQGVNFDNNNTSASDRRFNRRINSSDYYGHIIGLTYDASSTNIEDRLRLSWAMEHHDGSDNTGISMFDFNNDGASDLCYQDQHSLRVISPKKGNIDYVDINATAGTNASILFNEAVNSYTAFEPPVIADVNLDGSADIVVVHSSSSTCSRGKIRVYEHASGTPMWAPCPPVWNQGMYDPLQINENLTVPALPQSMLTPYKDKDDNTIYPYNAQWAQQPIVMLDEKYIPQVRKPDANAVLLHMTVKVLSNPARAAISFNVFNGGSATINANTPVSFYDGGTGGLGIGTGATLIGTQPIGVDIFSGEEVTRPFIINGNFNNHLLWARIVDDGTSFPAAGYLECDPTNNVYSGIDCPDLIYNVTVAPDAELCGIDDFATLTAVPENPQGAPTFQWYRNNVILENETSATLNATLAGTYKCYVVDGICRGFSSEMTITRSNYISYVTPSGGGDKDGSSWENAYQGLADALQTAASGTKCIREIWVAEGTYYPKYQAGTGTGITDRDKAFVMVEGVKIYGGFNGTLTGTPTVVPQFGATGRTGRSILSGDIDGNNTTDAGNVYHVVIAAGNGTTTYPYITDAACLDGFTVTGGYSYDLSGSQTILVNGVAVERTNGAGVAIYNSTPKIAYDTITGNRCGGNSSSSYDGYGGGIYATSTTTDTIKITNTVISNNTSNFYGGGIACDNINMTMTYSSVENNTATGNAAGGSGGGIFYRSSSKKLTLTNVTIKGNKAYSEVASGGGLQCICSTNLSSCTLSAELTNVAITGNLAESPSSTSFGAQGGGIYFDKSMALINVTIAGNNVINPTTAGGGGVDCSSGSTTNFSNCIIWGNRKAGTTVSNVPATGATYNYTLLEGTVPAGTGNKTGDPKFIAFMAASSAPTDGGDYRLQSDSPAIDAGNNSANTTPFDLAGSARKQGNAIDMGAYEYGISITGQPKPQTMLNVNCSDFLSIEASMDGGTLTYQWYSNTTPTNSGGTLISGATGKTLTIPATTYTIGTPHYYYCVVSATGISPLPTPASSNVATVTMLTKVVRYVKEGGTTVNDGISWATASGDLQAMINASCADDEIWVAAGTYKPIYTADGWNSSTKVYPNTGGGRDNAFVLKEGVTIYGGFQATGNPGFDDRQPISDNVDYKTILSGDIDDATNNDVYHVVVAANLDTALLDGFTITGAYNNVTVAGSITVNTRPVTRNYGGGIYVNGSMYFSNLKVINNTAFVMGGGAYLEPVNISEGAVFTNVAFLGNSVISDGVADGGGGICVNNGTHSMTNLLIAGNNATVIGGGILFRNVVSSNSTLTNITVAGNNAGNMGGGIYNGGSTVNIRNSVIWGNTANQVPVTNNIYDNNNITHSYNLVQNGSVSGTEIISNADPLFVSSIDYRLQSGSPAIDKGNNAHIAGFTTDLDGSLRIQGCRVDLGAYETKGVTPDANGIVYVNLLKNGNGLSWDNAYPNLADVLAAAEIGKNLCEGEIKEIWVAEGTYYPKYKAAEKDNLNNPTTDRDKAFVMVAGVKIYGGFTGDGTEDEITDRVTIANEHGFWQMVNKTILSGDIGTPNDVSDNVHHVVIAAGNMTVGGVTARLDGFTVTGGNAERLSSIFVNGVEISSTYSGGGITVIQASPVIINDSIADNKTSNSNGGGIHIYNGSNPVVTHTVINNNTASFNGGGVAIEESSNPVFSYTVIKNNISETAFGGGVSIIESSLAKFTNTVISGNTAPNGGGVAVRYNNTNNMPEFINTKIIGNTAIGDGGNGNGRGGGMQFMNGFAKVTNTLISGNTAYYYGGGVFVDGGDPEFINATIAGNYAANSGGLYNDGSNNGTVKLYNTIIYGNTGSINLGSYTAGNSLVQGVTLTGTGNFSNATNPLFVSLDQATLSTPTIGGDYHLNPLSPVVNAGDDSKNDEPYDLDGADRKQGTIDLGVYENEIEIIANDDYVAVAAPAIAKPVKIDVLANDLIPAGCTPVTITIDENGLHGNAVVNAAGDTVIYTPNNGYYGLDTLKYRVACGGTDATAYVYISVQEYPDNVTVAACYSNPPARDFGIAEAWQSTYNQVESCRPWFVGDLDGDDKPEIVAFSLDGKITTSLGKDFFNKILVFPGNDRDNYVIIETKKSDGSTVRYNGYEMISAIGIVRVNGQGLIVVACDDDYLRAYKYPEIQTTPAWTSSQKYIHTGKSVSTDASTIGFADFDNDGAPEVYTGNKIFNAATGAWLCEGSVAYRGFSIQNNTTNGGNLSVAVDVNGDGKLELITGNRAWSVENNGGTWSMTEYKTADLSLLPKIGGTTQVKEDGHVSIADLNNDGHPDAVISLIQAIGSYFYPVLYGWDIYNNRLLFHEYREGRTNEEHANKSIPFIGNIDADKPLEVICLFNTDLRAYNLPVDFAPDSTLSLAWNRSVNENYGRTGITLFDFNQDGQAELVYRDEVELRIINGTNGSDRTTFSCTSATTWEYPIVANVDDDIAAEIIVAGNVTNGGKMYIYKSATDAQRWAPARKVWNQYAYNVVNVSDSLTIPQYQFSSSTIFPGADEELGTDDDIRPFNNFLQQQTYLSEFGLSTWLAMDVEFNENDIEDFYYDAAGDSLTIRLKIRNVGSAPIAAPFYVTAYKDVIALANVIAVDSTSQPVYPQGETTISMTVRNISLHFPIYIIKIRLNDRKTVTELQLECKYDVNVSLELDVDKVPMAHNDYATIIDVTTLTVDILSNDSIPDDCASPVFSIIKFPSQGTASLNATYDSIVYVLTNEDFIGVDTVTYEIACGVNKTTANVYILRPKQLQADYIACAGKSVEIGFVEIDDVDIYWFDAETEGVQIESGASNTIVRMKDNSPVQIFWAEPRYGDDAFPRYPVRLRLNANVPIASDIRVEVCPLPSRDIYLTSFIDTLDVNSTVVWTSANNAFPVVANIAKGTVNTLNMKPPGTYTYRYTLTTPCGVSSAVAYVHVPQGKIPQRYDTILICIARTDAVNINSILGMELDGVWTPVGSIAAANTVVTTVSSQHAGAVIFDAKTAHQQATAASSNNAPPYHGIANGKAFDFEYNYTSACAPIGTGTKRIVIVTYE